MTHGGARAGAGRPRGEQTKTVRVPLTQLNKIMQLVKGEWPLTLPLYGSSVRAGFPSPADDYIEKHLDLNDYLIKHPAATFLVRAQGDSMINAGIHDGDILVVDRSLEPLHGRIVIAALNGELTVKRLYRQQGRVQLMAENSAYPALDISETMEMVIWGVVTNVIHAVE